MYALRITKNYGYMERKKGSHIMNVKIDKSLPVGTILPICIDNYIISESKVIESTIFSSTLKVVLCSDSEIIPHFEVFDSESIQIIKHSSMGTTESQIDEMAKVAKKNKLRDIRPCQLASLIVLVPDLFDYYGMKNLMLNVRFKK